MTAGNMVFALFTEGLMKVTEKLNNPLSDDDTSFSDIVFGNKIITYYIHTTWHVSLPECLLLTPDAFLLNNCMALRAGYLSYSSIAVIKIKPVRGSHEHPQN